MGEALGRSVASRERIEDLERPQLDDRSYRIITLPNQLEVLLIHEAGTDKASAALDVNVGSFSDAEDMPGIAHAVEHLLFMGTEKYPEENAYNKYLATHAGHSNAFTASTSTNYYYELSYPTSTPNNSKVPSPNASQLNIPESKDDSPLWGALDRFGQFFISPLFLEDTVDREIRAIDSENKENLQNDTRRLDQLNKALSNPEHPYCHFSTGSWKTLHDDPIGRGVKIRDEFIKFHSQHYSANRMKLVVLGRESLDTLEQWVEEIFSKVPNKDLPRKRWDLPVYTENELLIQTFARPVLELRSLDLSFLYRDEEIFYESKPSRYLSYLIGHEGPGSILAYIKSKGWAYKLSAGASTICPGTSLFGISVRLTENGLKHYKDVTKVIFQYICMVREQPPLKRIVDEQIRISEVKFRFEQKRSPGKTTVSLARAMQKPYDRKKILSGPAVIRKFDAELISEAMTYLRPDNFRMTIVSQDFPGEWDKKEKWYGTEYKTGKIPEDFLAELKEAFETKARPAELHFPHKNEFIPSRLHVEKKDVEEPTKTPKLIRYDDAVWTWWKKDDQFWVPEANVHIDFRTPMAHVTARVVVMCSMFRELVIDALEEYSYDADISGLTYEFSNHTTGMSITVTGYNDKLHVLLEKVLLSVRDLEVREDRFTIVHDKMMRDLRNWDYEKPFNQAQFYSLWFQSERSFMITELLEQLEMVTAQDVQQFYPQVLAQCQIEVLAHGNLERKEALEITDFIEKTMKCKKLPVGQLPIRRTLILPAGSNFIYERQLKDAANVNHCTEYNLYAGNLYDRNLRAKLLLIEQIIEEPTFHQLRTIEQLGYIVFSSVVFADTWAGYRILVQSQMDCRYLEGRIEHFLTSFEKTLGEMTQEDFEGHKRAIINKRLAKLKNLSEEENRFWDHIFDDAYDFNLTDIDVRHLEPLTKQDMTEFYAHYISPSSSTRAKLSIHLQAQAKAKEPTPEEKKTEAISALTVILTEEKATLNPEALQSRINAISSVAGDALPSAISAHLTEDLKLDKSVADKIFDEAMAALGLADAGLVAEPEVLDGKVDVEGSGTSALAAGASHPVLIKDAHAWKAGMQISTGVRPVRNFEEFLEGSAKL